MEHVSLRAAALRVKVFMGEHGEPIKSGFASTLAMTANRSSSSPTASLEAAGSVLLMPNFFSFSSTSVLAASGKALMAVIVSAETEGAMAVGRVALCWLQAGTGGMSEPMEGRRLFRFVKSSPRMCACGNVTDV